MFRLKSNVNQKGSVRETETGRILLAAQSEPDISGIRAGKLANNNSTSERRSGRTSDPVIDISTGFLSPRGCTRKIAIGVH